MVACVAVGFPDNFVCSQRCGKSEDFQVRVQESQRLRDNPTTWIWISFGVVPGTPTSRPCHCSSCWFALAPLQAMSMQEAHLQFHLLASEATTEASTQLTDLLGSKPPIRPHVHLSRLVELSKKHQGFFYGVLQALYRKVMNWMATVCSLSLIPTWFD